MLGEFRIGKRQRMKVVQAGRAVTDVVENVGTFLQYLNNGGPLHLRLVER